MQYDNRIVRRFALRLPAWGLVALIAGLLVALKLVFPGFSRGIPKLSYGRLRPLHTNAVIFAFVGNGMFMGIYYSLQRLCKARMFSDSSELDQLLGLAGIIVAAAITLPLGLHHQQGIRGTRMADRHRHHRWSGSPSRVNLLGTILKRREKHIYVAIWFYIATAITVAVLHIVNSLECRSSCVQELLDLRRRAGRARAVVVRAQRRRVLPHHAVPRHDVLLPAQGGGSAGVLYRLSIIHFWALIFIYIWAGPHHLLYTALPDWAQSLGMVFSLMLIAPSWGGMLNGLLTLRGAWDKVREDPVLKFMVVALTAYGMATLRRADARRSRASTRSRITPTGPSRTSTPARSAGTAS